MEGVRKRTPTESVSREALWLNPERHRQLKELIQTDPREALLSFVMDSSRRPSAETTQNH